MLKSAPVLTMAAFVGALAATSTPNQKGNEMMRALGRLLGVVMVMAGSLMMAPAAIAHPAGGLSAGTAGTAIGTRVDPVHIYQNQATGRCMDDSANGLRTRTCNGTYAQQWIVHRWDDGTYRFQNRATGRCIDDSANGLRTLPCNMSPNQSWIVNRWADGTRRYKNQATGRC